MNITLWAVQIFLGLMFLMAGFMKSAINEKSKEKLPWAKEYSDGYVRFIGISELLGGLGLILPGALGIATILTPIAALGIAVIMVLAIVFHIKRNENQALVMNVILLLLALFIVAGRLWIAPF
ncbi:DoxX family protein [Paenibacillus pinisoli]|uniref:DoxX family protein n=1 Tax=Paenibacillus pinisoli TaxID=1276110 RepID=A0A3A6PXM8_9BACL|nr:DoxX family protein [Paenibacillus pinisoli]RJX40123.1 DoxX family protein [Paenibacillus pinisoli]